MRLTLIFPALGPYVDEARMEPLPLGALAGLTPPEVEIRLYDERLGPIPFDEPADLVGISVQIFTARRAYEISAEYRKRGVPVILGGMHPTLLPEEAAQHADSIYLGDAEQLWPQVITDAQQHRLQPMYRATPGVPQPAAFTRRDVYQARRYLPITLMQFSRGCRYACEFCASSAYFRQTQFARSVRQVVREIEAQERRVIFFVDDNLLANFDAAKDLFRELIPLKIRWVSQGSIDMTQDRELMALMAKSGCLGHVIGFESLDPHDLQTMQKAANLTGGFQAYRPQLEVLRDYGLQTWAAFTLGHDHDTPASIERTLEFALENKFAFAAFNILMPYPGTPFYNKLSAEGRLLYGGRWWLHPAYRFNHAAFRPKQMTPEELTEAAFRARAEFNGFSSIWQRIWDFKTNLRSPYRLGAYLAYNPLFRQEVFKKQGLKLGLEE
jgi:radical SAM superfamily enzyme YgiQ (UPF0313 family)